MGDCRRSLGQAVSDTLFDLAPAGKVQHGAPSTSVEAARAVDAAGIRAAVLVEFRAFGWLTDDELAENLPQFVAASVKTARSALSSTRNGNVPLIVASGRKRPSNHGRPMIVWALANAWLRT